MKRVTMERWNSMGVAPCSFSHPASARASCSESSLAPAGTASSPAAIRSVCHLCRETEELVRSQDATCPAAASTGASKGVGGRPFGSVRRPKRRSWAPRRAELSGCSTGPACLCSAPNCAPPHPHPRHRHVSPHPTPKTCRPCAA
eukprot:1273642-Rhodomonas_salina.1